MSHGAARRIRVFVVDDHSLFRSGVRSEIEPAVEVVGEAGDVATAVERIRATAPDVVLLDVHLPDGGGAAVLGAVLDAPATDPRPRFLALSVSDAAEDVIGIIRGGARATSRSRSPVPSWARRSSGSTRATPTSRPGSPGSCSMRSGATRRWRSTRSSTS